MKLSYQVATPEVAIAPSVTSYQGDIEISFKELSEMGYEAVELMSRNPKEIDKKFIKELAEKYNLEIAMVCTGEAFGQDQLKLVDKDPSRRKEAFIRTKEFIDLASYFGAGINIGRLRGHYYDDVPRQETYDLAVTIMRELAEYAVDKGVTIVIEPVTMLQTNFINSSQEGLELVKKVNHPAFRLMIDIYHSNIEDKNIYESLRESKDYLAHVHVADNNRRIPGTCGFDFPEIIKVLEEIGYKGALAVEMFQIPDQKTAAKETAKFLKPLM